MESSETTATKSALRKQFDAARRDLCPVQIQEKSRAIQSHLSQLDVVHMAQCIHAYWPMDGDHEVDTRSFVESQYKRGVTVALPVVTRFDPDAPAMTQRAFTGATDLTENRWGILEPVDGPPVEAHTIDVVLVPALGAGRDGHRIGHGWGYYDRFLSSIPGATRIVLAFDRCLRATVPYDEHDVPAHIVVTESGVLRANHRSMERPSEERSQEISSGD